MTWNRFTMRKATAEEKARLGVDEFWNLPLPESEEQILVSDGTGIWIDEWYSDCGEAGLLDGDAEGLYWMSFPELPQETEGGENENF